MSEQNNNNNNTNNQVPPIGVDAKSADSTAIVPVSSNKFDYDKFLDRKSGIFLGLWSVTTLFSVGLLELSNRKKERNLLKSTANPLESTLLEQSANYVLPFRTRIKSYMFTGLTSLIVGYWATHKYNLFEFNPNQVYDPNNPKSNWKPTPKPPK